MNSSPLRIETAFLDEEERYEVFTVKAAERPHLLLHGAGGNGEVVNSDEKKEDGENNNFLPLSDGCDLAGWRRDGLVRVSDDLQGVLNVGAVCTMFRRESMLSLSYSCLLEKLKHDSTWVDLRQKLLASPPIDRDAAAVDCDEYSELNGTTAKEGSTKFAVEFELRNIPAKVHRAAEIWKAMPTVSSSESSQKKIEGFDEKCFNGWTFDNLVSRFSDISWRFSDTHGEMMTLGTYAKYIHSPEGLTDDSPLAIYDAEFGDDSPTNVLTADYTVPTCFSRDLFELAEVTKGGGTNAVSRPPYRWILIGPARSGTGLHIDPLWTNAWVTVLQGLKRWLLFPSATPPERVGMIEGEPQIPSVIWFRDYYDLVTDKENWPVEWKPVEVLQGPGETVFVPNGWMHLVLNLELTVAVTHNYASEHGPFERMWQEVVTEEPQFASSWYKGLFEHRPDLAARIRCFHSSHEELGDEWACSFPLPE